ncbi:MAG: hypothetical protein NC918_00810 [Candidatus Omnitrophica bacterium]|nr:hypothetical protein [Candidatus Omnitrophota bacterium]
MDILKLIKNNKSLISSANELCAECKRNSRVYCPHKFLLKLKKQKIFDKDSFFGPTPPNVFVSHLNYPNIAPQPIFLLDEEINVNPSSWYGWDFKKILYACSMQVRAQFPKNLAYKRVLFDVFDASLSTKAVDVQADYIKKPSLFVNFHQIHSPLGPKALVKNFSLASNPSIPKKVDSILEENLAANTMIWYLAKEGFDEFYISRVLSIGLLGKSKNKRLVPTKWSITATDFNLAKFFINQLKKLSCLEKILVFENFYLANKFSIILFPGMWEFENIEVWCGSKTNFAISSESESFYGRNNYAFKQGGGYYASLFAVSQGLFKKIKKQAKVLVIREIMPEYDLPVGVWEIRENIRHAFEKEPRRFDTKKELFNYLQTSLFLDLKNYIKFSRFLNQPSLKDF